MVDPLDDSTSPASSIPEELQASIDRFLTGDLGQDPVDGVNRAAYETLADHLQNHLAENRGGHGAINTRTGREIRPLAPDPEKIQLDDIAHGLANIGRFAGQGTEFYSVARHSVHVAFEVDARGGGRETQRHALLHDAPEAYLSDVPGPVKKSLPGYARAERRLYGAVVEAFDLSDDADRDLVEDADMAVREYELGAHFPDSFDGGTDCLEHDPNTVLVDAGEKALFLDRARELGLR